MASSRRRPTRATPSSTWWTSTATWCASKGSRSSRSRKAGRYSWGYRVNVLGSMNVFDAARDNAVERVVFTSSKAVYGSLGGAHSAPVYEPVTEDHVGQTTNVYGASKKALEDAAYHYRRLFGLDI